MIDWTDRRPINTMPFGADTPEAARADTATIVRGILTACGCTIADDITKLGCTGLAAHVEKVVAFIAQLPVLPVPFDTVQDRLVTAWGRFLRLGLAGGGVGLPCFVPPDRYCLVHDTIGGLQDGQQQHHVELVDAVSRELTAAERASTAMVESARRVKGAEAASELLTGWKRGEAVKAVKERLEEEGVGELPVELPVGAPVAMREAMPNGPVTFSRTVAPWTCAEHEHTNWKCRYCVAQAVVEGELEPSYSITFDTAVELVAAPGVPARGISPEELQSQLDKLDGTGVPRVDVYVHAARFTRKLSQD